MSKEGESIFTFGDNGPEKLQYPNCCILNKNIFLVSDGGNHCIKAFDQSGTFLYKFGKEGNQDGQFTTPYGLLIDGSNNLLVCDSGNSRVQQFSLDGRFTGKSIIRLSKPKVITKAPDGRILVSSHNDKKVYILKQNIFKSKLCFLSRSLPVTCFVFNAFLSLVWKNSQRSYLDLQLLLETKTLVEAFLYIVGSDLNNLEQEI